MDTKAVFGFVDPKVRNAALQVAEQLRRLGVRFALAGGLAVGVHGYVRATKDVDFLVGEEAFEHHGLFVTFKAGVPIQVDGIQVDYLSAFSLGEHLVQDLEHPSVCDGLPVVSIESLIYMKLVARRRQDQLDVIQLIKAGANTRSLRRYLQEHAADQLPLFEELLEEAEK
ncbi:hypothetical protein L6R29_03355 [Myxococcota bacterium]|nr:hypothetical protein [Myxococcota bacterium]